MGDVETEYAARIVGRVWNGHAGMWAVVDVVVDMDMDVVMDNGCPRCRSVTRHSRAPSVIT